MQTITMTKTVQCKYVRYALGMFVTMLCTCLIIFLLIITDATQMSQIPHKATYDAVKIWKTIFDAFTQSPTFCSKSRKRALHQVNEKFFLIGGLCINLIGL